MFKLISVCLKSRAQNFYYGHPQNAFWKIISRFFGEPVPLSVEKKKELLSKRKLALWDIVTECEIVGSSDASIKNYSVADVPRLIKETEIKAILVNGTTPYKIFIKNYPDVGVPVYKMPSTSPANFHRKEEEWYDILQRTFGRA